MNTPSTVTPATAAAPVPAWRRWLRRLYLLAAGLTGAAIIGQVFFAGAAVLVDPGYWAAHRALGNALELVALVLLLLGLGTGLPWRIQGWGGLLYVLLFCQYLFLYLMPQTGAPLLRSLHAVNALALFGVTVLLVMRVYQHAGRG
jgi:hypothetical protein